MLLVRDQPPISTVLNCRLIVLWRCNRVCSRGPHLTPTFGRGMPNTWSSLYASREKS
ncbi:hypothetical protein M404DRAFT_1004159, partial [Pisolithus tinctorius Marx 270]